MLRRGLQVGEASFLALLGPKAALGCGFSTVASRVAPSWNHCKTCYKRCSRSLRGSSFYRPEASESPDEDQRDVAPKRRRSVESDSEKTEDPGTIQHPGEPGPSWSSGRGPVQQPPAAKEMPRDSTSLPKDSPLRDWSAPPGSRVVKQMLRDSTSLSEMGPKDSPLRDWSTLPYPKEEARRLQARHAFRPKVDPTETSVILFPGQGIQYPGMAKRLLKYPNVKRIYESASEILGYDLLDLCLTGSREELSKTVFCQPAIVATSLAVVEKLRDENPPAIDTCIAVAGFSVGEITALMFAGALSFTDGMKLVRIRAEAMQGASEMVAGGMMVVFYGADSRVGFACLAAQEWCKKQGLPEVECRVANYLFPGCKVIAGNEEAMKFIAMNAKDFKLRRIKHLPVSGAFHTKLMLPAQEALSVAMDSLTVNDPTIAVHSNVDGKRYRDARHIKRQLPKQICSPVKWEQTLHILYERDVGKSFPRTYECGPGRSMKEVLEKVNAKAHGSTVSVGMEDLY